MSLLEFLANRTIQIFEMLGAFESGASLRAYYGICSGGKAWTCTILGGARLQDSVTFNLSCYRNNTSSLGVYVCYDQVSGVNSSRAVQLAYTSEWKSYVDSTAALTIRVYPGNVTAW